MDLSVGEKYACRVSGVSAFVENTPRPFDGELSIFHGFFLFNTAMRLSIGRKCNWSVSEGVRTPVEDMLRSLDGELSIYLFLLCVTLRGEANYDRGGNQILAWVRSIVACDVAPHPTRFRHVDYRRLILLSVGFSFCRSVIVCPARCKQA